MSPLEYEKMHIVISGQIPLEFLIREGSNPIILAVSLFVND